jgi:hypothetical protein
LPILTGRIAQERGRQPVRLRQPPPKAGGGVFFEADSHGLAGRGFQRLAVVGFVDHEDWRRLLFHPRSRAETARGGNSILQCRLPPLIKLEGGLSIGQAVGGTAD